MEKDYTCIKLSNGGEVKVDPDDYEWLVGYKWSKGGSDAQYARLATSPSAVYMHRLIMKAPPHLCVDHINGDTFDNRKSNLRLTTLLENSYNQKGTGIYQDKKSGLWIARIKVNYKGHHIGCYKTPEEAMRAYDAAARYYFGVYARTNFYGSEAKSIEEIRADSNRVIAGETRRETLRAKGFQPEVECAWCAIRFRVQLGRAKKGAPYFCSQSHAALYRERGKRDG